MTALGRRLREECEIDKHLDGSHRRIRVTVGGGKASAGIGMRLDRLLVEIFPSLSRSLIASWLNDGFGVADGRPAKPGTRVRLGMHIALDCPLPPGGDDLDEPELELLYDRDGVVVANKPPGQLAHQAGRVLTGTLLNQLQDLAAERGIDPREARLVNRIDRDTSGIVLATLDEDAHRRLSIALQQRELGKRYHALCLGIPDPEHGHWREPIGDDPTGFTIARQVRADGQASHTEYRVVERTAAAARLAIDLHTGRQHQIRVHAAHAGHPLIGDWVYGGACAELSGQALHAAELTFPDPTGRGRPPITVTAPLPGALGRLWQACLDGAVPTPRELVDDERIRLGLDPAIAPDDPDQELPDGWHRPTWMSRAELAELQREADGPAGDTTNKAADPAASEPPPEA